MSTVTNSQIRAVRETPGFPEYQIRPDDIKLSSSGSVPGTFGKYEVEESAGRLIQFFQERGWWITFSISELADFYRAKKWDLNLMFFGLMGLWFDDAMVFGGYHESWPCLALNPNGRYSVTSHFIERCAGKLNP